MKTGQTIRYQILSLEKSGMDYMDAEDAVLSECEDEEIVEYNMYMARICGVA
jgi:hypothetical protein